jgi:hypothetical protein
MSPQTMPPSCLGKGKVLTDKFNGDLTAEEVSRLDHRFDVRERRSKEIGKKSMEFTAAADNGRYGQNNGGAMVQIATWKLTAGTG